MLCAIFKVSQSVNTAPAVRIARIIYRYAFPLSDTAVTYARSAIFRFATTAPTMASVNCCGERRWIYEVDEL